eukprot:CAMPEP_0194287400 /NCGR_PEP_ID=MMETSP0169-20130528/34668_1 /TAXON_ID=218684 /ORGANISM="Corethron pennatum, Strain L29A3" /LENGTH=222 /DNA_ID=CAMNT_0039034087 /DNA_START=43 /DNA_END=706 /DNA_ORIENTATION=-
MAHLAGYKQHDAHEFLQAFLDTLGRDMRKFETNMNKIRRRAVQFRKKEDSEKESRDVIKDIFEGKLRSVLVCRTCGTRRTMSESFLNISLSVLPEKNAAGSKVDAQPNATSSGDIMPDQSNSSADVKDGVDPVTGNPRRRLSVISLSEQIHISGTARRQGTLCLLQAKNPDVKTDDHQQDAQDPRTAPEAIRPNGDTGEEDHRFRLVSGLRSRHGAVPAALA